MWLFCCCFKFMLIHLIFFYRLEFSVVVCCMLLRPVIRWGFLNTSLFLLVIILWVCMIQCNMRIRFLYLAFVLHHHTCQTIQFTSIKYFFFLHYFGGHMIWPYWKMDPGKQFSWDFAVVLKRAKRLKNCWMSSWHTPSPNAHWLA